MFENHLKGLILQHNFNFRAKNNVKINWCKNSFHFDDFATFFCWFSNIVQTEQTSSKFEKLSRHCPGFLLLLQWSIIAEIESVNWEGIRNFLARVWKIAMRLEVEKKCWENIKGRKDQEEGCCSVHFRQTNSKELGARG